MTLALAVERVIRARAQSPRQFNTNDIILASYPKSGNTWLRFILSNLTKILSESSREVDFHSINYYAPHIGGLNEGRSEVYSPTSKAPRFLKTHFYHVSRFEKYKKILLIRNPKDTLVSFYDYSKFELGRDVGDIDDFVWHWRRGVKGWNYFYKTWIGNFSSLIKYEELVQDPVGVLSISLNEVGVQAETDIIKRAVELSSRNNMRLLLDSKGDPFRTGSNYEFVRKDERSNRSVDISSKTLLEVFEVSRKVASAYGYSF